ncbi:MAG: hypothetical protein M1308_22620 [Actinobacteria bacterium]|nr:hypothetical protein [Actinomycetota bacterium]
MNELTQKFNLYDNLAYVLVGLYQIFIWLLLYILLFDGKAIIFFDFLKIEFTVTLILISYLAGHLVQAISNIFGKWEKDKKEERKKDLSFVIDKARSFFNLSKTMPDRIIWQYCYLFALSNDFSGHVTLFNSMYSLYRGLWVASSNTFIISTMILLIQLIVFFISKLTIFPNWKLIPFTLVISVFSIMFNRRKKRFFNYMSEKTLITFDILLKISKDKNISK